MLTDESVEDEFNRIIRLNTGFIPERGVLNPRITHLRHVIRLTRIIRP